MARDWSGEFVNMMQNRIVMSHYKYGWISDCYDSGLAKAIESLEKRLSLYKQTGNREWLVDVANFCMIEYTHPQHPNAHFRATGSEESPGLVGTSYNEFMGEAESHE